MPPIEDYDAGLSSDADRLAALLSKPDPAASAEHDAEPVVPVKPAAVKTAQRNTVAPQPSQPAAEEPSGEDDGDGEGESTPTEAPASWDAEGKKVWAKLPDDVKAIITARETERDTATNTRLREAAEIERAAKALEAETAQKRTAYEQRLVLLAKQLENTIPAEFQHIRSNADLQALAQKDPAAVTRFMAWRESASAVVNELRQLEQTKVEEAKGNLEKTLEKEARALVAKWPEAVDPVKGPAIRAEISTTLKGFGFTDEEIGNVSDHRILLFAKQFIEGQKALKAHETAAKKLEKKPLPRVVKPSAGDGAGSSGGLSKAQLTRVARSGDMGATQAALERILGTSG